MAEEVEITVENKLIAEKRDLNVYHHSTRSAHIISPGSSTTLGLLSVEEEDYLLIAVVKGPGDLFKDSILNIPSWADFECNSSGSINLIHTHHQEGDRLVLKIPPGPPTWELKITKPTKSTVNGRLTKKGNYVTVADR